MLQRLVRARACADSAAPRCCAAGNGSTCATRGTEVTERAVESPPAQHSGSTRSAAHMQRTALHSHIRLPKKRTVADARAQACFSCCAAHVVAARIALAPHTADVRLCLSASRGTFAMVVTRARTSDAESAIRHSSGAAHAAEIDAQSTRARTQRLLLHRCCPRQTSIAMGGTAGPRDEHGAVLDCAVAHAVSVAERPNSPSAYALAVQLDRHGRQRKELLQQHARPLARERQPCSHLSPCRLQSHFT